MRTITEHDTRRSIVPLKTVTKRSIIGFPHFKDVIKYVSRQLHHKSMHTRHSPSYSKTKQTVKNKLAYGPCCMEIPMSRGKIH